MNPRIYGQETELGLVAVDDKGRMVSDPVITDTLFRSFIKDVPGFRSPNCPLNGYLPNGSRFYADTGGHPEIAGPECLRPRDLALYEFANYCFISRYYKKIASSFAAEHDGFGLIFANDNVTRAPHSSSVTWGQHLNVSWNSQKCERHCMANYLAPLIVTITASWGGSGLFRFADRKERLEFLISPRLEFMDSFVGGNTTSQRGVVNLRGEDHTQDPRFSRLHIIGVDSLRLPMMIWLRTAVIGLIVELIEEGIIDRPLIQMLSSQEKSCIRQANRSYSLKDKVWLTVNKGGLSTLEVQRLYYQVAVHYFSQPSRSSSETRQVLKFWDQVLTGLEKNGQGMFRLVEWLFKWHYFNERFLRRNIVGLETSRYAKELKKFSLKEKYKICAADAAFHRLTGLGSECFNNFVKVGYVEMMFSKDEIDFAMQYPPGNTRAYARGQVIRAHIDFGQKSPLTDLDWDSVTILIKRTRDKQKMSLPGIPSLVRDISSVKSIVREIEKAIL